MCCELVLLGDPNIDRVLADPPLIWRVVAPDDPQAYEEARAAATKPSLLARLFGRGRRGAPGDLVMAPPEGETADLDKAWHGIHYLLTGTAYEGPAPLAFLVCGGRQVGDIEVGYGPARVFAAAETKRTRDALAALGDAQLRARFAPADMMRQEIYPEIWDRAAEHDDTLGYLMENLRALRALLDKAAARRMGLVVRLT